jgi:hypothetical protein
MLLLAHLMRRVRAQDSRQVPLVSSSTFALKVFTPKPRDVDFAVHCTNFYAEVPE